MGENLKMNAETFLRFTTDFFPPYVASLNYNLPILFFFWPTMFECLYVSVHMKQRIYAISRAHSGVPLLLMTVNKGGG